MIIIFSNQSKSLKYIREINITITNYPDTIQIKDNETKNITVDGIVYCEMYGFNSISVTLTASDTYGSAVITPSTILFNSQGSQNEHFTVSARIPKLLEGEYIETITVYGYVHEGHGESYKIESEPINITVLVVNETSTNSPDIKNEENGGYKDEFEIIPIFIILGIFIVILVLFWLVKKRKRVIN